VGYNEFMATATIEVDERIAAALRAQAEARHLPLTTFLQRIAEISLPAVPPSPNTEEEWIRMFDDVSADSPNPGSNFSRADIYFDHD
jgi:hypothetical protein